MNLPNSIKTAFATTAHGGTQRGIICQFEHIKKLYRIVAVRYYREGFTTDSEEEVREYYKSSVFFEVSNSLDSMNVPRWMPVETFEDMESLTRLLINQYISVDDVEWGPDEPGTQ